jgi:hypothetical protein
MGGLGKAAALAANSTSGKQQLSPAQAWRREAMA